MVNEAKHVNANAAEDATTFVPSHEASQHSGNFNNLKEENIEETISTDAGKNSSSVQEELDITEITENPVSSPNGSANASPFRRFLGRLYLFAK